MGGFLVVALLVLMLNLTANGCQYYTMTIDEERNTIRFWVKLVKQNTTIITNVLMASILVAVISVKWRPFWTKEHRMEQFMSLPAALLHQLRKMAVATSATVVFFIILDIGILSYQHVYTDNSTARDILITTGVEISDLYIYLSVILFVYLTYVASKSLQVIIEDVRSHLPKLHSERDCRLRKWHQSYALIHDYVEEVDAFFGPILLVFFVIKIFRLTLEEIGHSDARTIDIVTVIWRVIYFAKVFLYLSLLAFRTQNMKHQAKVLTKELGKCCYTDKGIQYQIEVYHFIIEIYRNQPMIRPMGMFEVSPKLFLVFTGTTMTYMIVLAQFAGITGDQQ